MKKYYTFACMGVFSLFLTGIALSSEIHELIKAHDIATVQKLLKEKPGEVLNAKAKGGSTPLHWTVVYGFTQGAKLLLENGADVNAKREGDSTPLHWAANKDAVDMAILLVSKGAMVDARTDKG